MLFDVKEKLSYMLNDTSLVESVDSISSKSILIDFDRLDQLFHKKVICDKCNGRLELTSDTHNIMQNIKFYCKTCDIIESNLSNGSEIGTEVVDGRRDHLVQGAIESGCG